jgi:hypothetical protein
MKAYKLIKGMEWNGYLRTANAAFIKIAVFGML